MLLTVMGDARRPGEDVVVRRRLMDGDGRAHVLHRHRVAPGGDGHQRIGGTVIAPRVLKAAGAIRRPRTTAMIRGVTGEATADVYEIASLEVGEAKVGRLAVVAHEIGATGSDGLLGRDFLDNFKYTIDNGAGMVTLSAK